MTRAYILENLEIIEGFFGICLGNAAPGSEAETHFRSLMTAAKEAQEIIDRTPRLMTREAFRAQPMGTGWLEWDLEDGETPAEAPLTRVAWVDGHAVTVDDSGCESYLDLPILRYNRPGGFRIWMEKPTDEERKEAAWDD